MKKQHDDKASRGGYYLLEGVHVQILRSTLVSRASGISGVFKAIISLIFSKDFSIDGGGNVELVDRDETLLFDCQDKKNA